MIDTPFSSPRWLGATVTFAYRSSQWLAEGAQHYAKIHLRYCPRRDTFLLCLQWFGDTVTFAYWGSLWLAEGPATYFEDVGGEAAFPGSAFLDRFFADSMTRFLEHDAAAGATHPLAVESGEKPTRNRLENRRHFQDPRSWTASSRTQRFLERDAAAGVTHPLTVFVDA